MKIGIVGSGKMGSAIGMLLSNKGHLVKFSYSKHEQKLQQLAGLNHFTSAGTVEEAIEFGDVILLTVPYSSLEEILSRKNLFKQKIVITSISGIHPDFTGDTIGLYTSLSVSVAEHVSNTLQAAKVFEAFNSIFAEILHLSNRDIDGKKPAIFYCGDDVESKKIVASLIEDCDYIAINAGGLKTARALETLAASWIQFAVVAGLYPRIALHTLHY